MGIWHVIKVTVQISGGNVDYKKQYLGYLPFGGKIKLYSHLFISKLIPDRIKV